LGLEYKVKMKGCGGSPKHIISEAISIKEKSCGGSDGIDYDLIWCVMDVEAPKQHSDLDEAFNDARGKSWLITILSNPCFEYWLLLHYGLTSAYMNSNDELIDLLKKKFPNYMKGNGEIFNDIQDKIEEACKNSKQVIKSKRYEKTHGRDLRKCNPSTHVHFIVEKLIELSKHRKKSWGRQPRN
jgi:hypothetical protein